MKAITSDRLLELEEICPGQVVTGASLAELSNWRVGGRAAAIVTPNSMKQLIDLRRYLFSTKLPHLVIGNTTNLLFTDADIDAVFIRLGPSFSEVSIQNNTITAQAGIWVPRLARCAMRAGLTGLEHVCGIPGTLGGLVVMNGGSQRKSIAQAIRIVETLDAQGRVQHYMAEQCGFEYRSSVFQNKNEIITQVTLELETAPNKRTIQRAMFQILRGRSKRFPRKLPNCGSVFVSNPDMYERYGAPGQVIEKCGLKGLVRGGAQVSPQHANFIINFSKASAEDILYLINEVRDVVFRKTGYVMKVEARFVDASGRVAVI